MNEQTLKNESMHLASHNQTASIVQSTNLDELFVPYNELISELNGTCSFWTNIVILIFFLFFFRLIGYLVLRFVCAPK